MKKFIRDNKIYNLVKINMHQIKNNNIIYKINHLIILINII
jgi:hypothetical protein